MFFRMVFFFIGFLFYVTHSMSQNYPQGYFIAPLENKLLLAGNFGEIRNNHFHGGLDLRTEGREGKRVLAAADGYVSRISISSGGYGKCLYITHPNGYTTVYGHLKILSGEILKYCLKQQHKWEKYEEIINKWYRSYVADFADNVIRG
ncbi:MAG: M23 family metallopeptidase [Bacteroidetes bacterium]|nr:M23 family metallopeptidase [Bacteroidota bacterium]